MISSIKGVIQEKKPPVIVIECGGLGYELWVPLNSFPELPKENETVFLYTMLIVREDSHILYGFHSQQERSLFSKLLKITGVGAKSALAIISTLSLSGAIQAFQNANISQLTKVPGIGKKTAERLIMELKDTNLGLTETSSSNPEIRLIEALQTLGYKPQEIQTALKQLTFNDDQNLASQIKLALQVLSGR